MTAALGYGLLASAAFPIGVLIGLFARLPRRVLASVVAFGAGTLVVALTFELMAEAIEEGSIVFALVGLFAGALLYILLDTLLDHMAKKSPRLEGHDPHDVKPHAAAIPETGGQATAGGLAVLVGSVLDGIPENAAIGMGLAAERGPGLGLVLLGAVFLSNLPSSVASTVAMRRAGRSRLFIIFAWLLVAVLCVAACVAGYALLADLPDAGKSLLLAFAAGGILAMLSDTMFPEAFRDGGPWVALATTAGFACSILLGELH